MKNKINYYMLFVGLFLMASIAACKKDNNDRSAHSSGQPMNIFSFSPAEGPLGTVILLDGNNFSLDTSQIKVSINGVPLKIIGATGTKIAAQLMSPLSSGPVVIKIGNDTVSTPSKFNYVTTYVVSTFAGSGIAGYKDAKGTDATFDFGAQAQMGIDANGNLYIPARNNVKFRKITPDGTVTTFAGQFTFNKPSAAGVAPDGNVWLADRGTKAIYKCSPDGSTVTKIIGTDTCGGRTNGNTEVYSFAFDNDGGVYWSDFRGPKTEGINRLKNGIWKCIIPCSLPGSMVMDANRNIYATHYDNQVIKKYNYNAANDTWDAGVIIAGMDQQSGWGDGPGVQAKFARPWALAFDKWGNLLCCGQGQGEQSNCVRKISLAAPFQVTTIAGMGAKAGFNDGTGIAASFNGPVGIVVSKDGTIYVLDRENNRIRKIEEK